MLHQMRCISLLAWLNRLYGAAHYHGHVCVFEHKGDTSSGRMREPTSLRRF